MRNDKAYARITEDRLEQVGGSKFMVTARIIRKPADFEEFTVFGESDVGNCVQEQRVCNLGRDVETPSLDISNCKLGVDRRVTIIDSDKLCGACDGNLRN